MKCVRCSSDKAKSKGGRCPKCLALLKKRKQDPDRHEHYDAVASDAMRRQSGSGKSSKKSKGVGTTQDIEPGSVVDKNTTITVLLESPED